jgi:hypothetical protein
LEAVVRGYHFDKDKIGNLIPVYPLPISTGQLEFKKQHLLKKLKFRYMEKYKEVLSINFIETHLLFFHQKGEIED